MAQAAQKFEVEFLKQEQVARGASSFFFKKPQPLDFLPGQFMRLTLEIPQPDERGNSRFFSIASSPTEENHLMVTTRSNHSAFKKILFNLTAGTKVQIAAPYGVFILKLEEKVPHIFLAGGIGITPFRSMIRYTSDMKLNIPITLFASFRTVEDVIFQKELQTTATKHSRFKFVETITQPYKSTSWQGNVGRIDEGLIKKHAPSFSSSIFYAAGPPAMVDAMVDLVKSLGVSEAQIRKEKFSGY